MEILKARRTPLRTAFTLVFTSLNKELESSETNVDVLESLKDLLKDKLKRMRGDDDDILNQLLEDSVELVSIELVDMEEMEDTGEMVDLASSVNSISFCESFNISMVVILMHQKGWVKFSEIVLKRAVF
ncbi:hypothetical protein NPIL_71651 [Nephila pilipes]|uniref:Uncharacterized protein n=1 Tax=Nephila pilipes TaxID=299642 RepID=A0A8X6NUA1_NEPPI|nr:hypothetical protein NPIL_71651 [Nephila pilipes]